jgi:hypothetical protein
MMERLLRSAPQAARTALIVAVLISAACSAPPGDAVREAEAWLRAVDGVGCGESLSARVRLRLQSGPPLSAAARDEALVLLAARLDAARCGDVERGDVGHASEDRPNAAAALSVVRLAVAHERPSAENEAAGDREALNALFNATSPWLEPSLFSHNFRVLSVLSDGKAATRSSQRSFQGV